MLEHLIPSRRDLPGDVIFGLNAQAQARRAAGEDVLNATVGALMDDGGRMVVLESVMKAWAELTPPEVAPYAPIAGDPAFLDALSRRHWPAVACATGCATPGGSGALALSARNLLEPGMRVLAAGPVWGPYHVLASENGVSLAEAPFPAPGRPLDPEAWLKRGSELMTAQKRLLVWLNDPCHNPTGRSLTRADREALFAVLRTLADRGPVTLLLDFAYLDYTRDPAGVREALDDYARLGEEGRILVGASLSLSKSLTLYGGRGGALVFPWCADTALQAALAVSCRGLFSNCSRAAQSLLLRMTGNPARMEELKGEHAFWSGVLGARAKALDTALEAEGLEGAAWTGGFFTALGVGAPERVCARLRDEGIFVVPLPKGMRVGVCGLREQDAPRFAKGLRLALSTN